MNNRSYNTATDLRGILHTDLTDTEITEIIQQSDAEITKQIGIIVSCKRMTSWKPWDMYPDEKVGEGYFFRLSA